MAPQGQVPEPIGVDEAAPSPPARPRVPPGLHERVVGLLTAMGYKPAESRALVRRAIAGDELPTERAPTTEELLRASLRAGNVPRSKRHRSRGR